MTRAREGGYAMLAAVAAIAAFALISLEVISVWRGVVASANGQVENAKLTAAADAGVALALYNTALKDQGSRWSIDGRSRQVRFGNALLTIVVEDEHGKIPINRLNEDQVRQMFQVAGVTGNRLDELTDCFEDWQDEDDDKRPFGAEAPDYLPQGYKPRNGDFRTLGELAMVKGMDAQLYAKLAPALTVFFGETGSFSVEDAQPLALAVLSGTGTDSPDVIEREREMAGEKPALGFSTNSPQINLVGRPLTIRVLAQDPSGARVTRTEIVELTGNKTDPYWVRFVE